MKNALLISLLNLLFTTFVFAQWSYLGLGNKSVNKISILDSIAYVATDDGLFRKNLDVDDTLWTAIGLQGKMITDFILFDHYEIVACITDYYAVVDTSLYKTSDGGINWIPYQNGFGGEEGSKECHALEMNPDAPDTLYARGSWAVAKSTNRGQNWQCVYGNWDQFGYQSPLIKIDRNNPAIVWAGGESSIFSPYLLKSTDYGNNWQFISIDTGGDNACYSLVINPNNSNEALVGMEGRIMHTSDGGGNWNTIFSPASYTYIIDMEVSLNNSNLVYATGSDNGTGGGDLLFYKSGDFGNSWDTIKYTEGTGIYSAEDLEIKKTGNIDELFLATNRGVYKYINSLSNIDEPTLINDMKLFQNYPNPFNPTTTIRYHLPESGFTTIEVFNIAGQLIETLVREHKSSGFHSVEWNTPNAGSGIYFYRMKIGNFIDVKKCVKMN
ncbi:MAG: T9SS type A sorting domain-containing protein [Candidatus Marinimicrobia bacterium]|nr:T9SS type A sorting domain-containing protein [Candidatus Neomarinimicrobiota bacterium]